MNQQNCGASTLPPITITISCVSLISGSKPRLPPGELSNMKPKSGTGMNKTDTQNFITNSCPKITIHNSLFINTLFITLFFVILLLEKSEIISILLLQNMHPYNKTN
jgi:hypothetical protein